MEIPITHAHRLSFTLDEFCDVTGFNRANVYKAMARGQLRTFKYGKRRMISADAAKEFIAELDKQGRR